MIRKRGIPSEFVTLLLQAKLALKRICYRCYRLLPLVTACYSHFVTVCYLYIYECFRYKYIYTVTNKKDSGIWSIISS